MMADGFKVNGVNVPLQAIGPLVTNEGSGTILCLQVFKLKTKPREPKKERNTSDADSRNELVTDGDATDSSGHAYTRPGKSEDGATLIFDSDESDLETSRASRPAPHVNRSQVQQ
ncbi:hypothetical protein MRX96_052146 [Rhipicephalus microplus]